MIRNRSFNRLRLLVVCVMVLNVIALIAAITMQEELVFLHIPLVMGCLISLVPVLYMNMVDIRSKRVGRYSLFKLIILVLVCINMIITLTGVSWTSFSYVFSVPIFILPDINMALNINKVQ